MRKYVAFDVDGTLNRTELYAVEAYQKALAKRGYKVKPEDIITWIGMNPMAIAERIFGNLEETQWEAWISDIESYEHELMKEKADTFAGVREMLETLKKAGYGLAICSNAFPDHIEGVLTSIGIRGYFDLLGSLEKGKNKSEILGWIISQVKPDRICMVGDRVFDLRAARDNRIPVIGCAYGYAPQEIQEADLVVHQPEELPAAIEKLIGKKKTD